jgi:hypothetical protein
MQTGSGFYARPSSSFGYWRGGGSELPLAQNQGSAYSTGGRAYGQDNSGVGVFPQGSGPQGSASGWTPTVTYLLIFVAAEMILFKCIERMLR